LTENEFRRDFGRLLRELLNERISEGRPVSAVLREHLGDAAAALPVVSEELDGWELPNLQLAIDDLLERPDHTAEVVGLVGQHKRYAAFSLSDLLSKAEWVPDVGPPEYVNVPVGPDRTLACLDFALVLLRSPSGASVVFVRRGIEGGPTPRLSIQVVAADQETARALVAELRRLMEEHDVYRGQMLTVRTDPHGGRDLVFLRRPELAASEIVMPEGVLERIERHVIGPSRHRRALTDAGRHLSRGLLLWGAPGTGKSHTVRYLASVLTDTTVIVLSGGMIGMVGGFAGLAKRLAPSLVVLEDVDLVAQERTYGPFGSNPVLFELMNEMDGVGEDADVAWVLTTNRPDVLEPALAARPGRIDLAVEIPLPDEEARGRLLDLYGRGLDLRLEDRAAVIRRTRGVPASFVKELLRKAALTAAEEGRTAVTDADVAAVLDELLHESAALTRVLLGAAAPSGGAAPDPHAWLAASLEASDEPHGPVPA
jgi:cell division protease FtsH